MAKKRWVDHSGLEYSFLIRSSVSPSQFVADVKQFPLGAPDNSDDLTVSDLDL